MPDLNDLNLVKEEIPGEVLTDLPDQGGGFEPLLQPGIYTFKLPDTITDFETFETAVGQRLRVNFKGKERLTVPSTGATVITRLDNEARMRGKRGEQKLASDMGLLLAACGVENVSGGNAGYGNALKQQVGKLFRGEWTWTAYCNPKKEVYDDGGAKVPGSFGCGTSYTIGGYSYTKADGTKVEVVGIPAHKEGPFAGLYPERFTCACGASMRAFGELSRIWPKA